MAEHMGVSQPSYSRLESGKLAFSIDQMYQAAGALGISGDEITRTLNTYVSNLRANGVEVLPQLRGNATKAGQEDFDTGALVVGTALGALLISILGSK